MVKPIKKEYIPTLVKNVLSKKSIIIINLTKEIFTIHKLYTLDLALHPIRYADNNLYYPNLSESKTDSDKLLLYIINKEYNRDWKSIEDAITSIHTYMVIYDCIMCVRIINHVDIDKSWLHWGISKDIIISDILGKNVNEETKRKLIKHIINNIRKDLK